MTAAYVADTNVYIRSTNDSGFASAFEAFQRSSDPLIVSTVVLAEVMLGTESPAIQDSIVAALTAGAPAVTPTGADWLTAATALTRLGSERVTKSRSFWNDAILAAQCARLGATLITHNVADFRRLRGAIAVDVAEPFPRPR